MQLIIGCTQGQEVGRLVEGQILDQSRLDQFMA